MSTFIIRNAQVVNEGRTSAADVLVKDGLIERIAPAIEVEEVVKEVNAVGRYLLPGVIDVHVHFRQPGLTEKATIATESRAAVAGGVTSIMEMPNTKPLTVTLERLEEKFELAKGHSATNYSFYLGATNDNLEELKRADSSRMAGIKVFMGSSTGNMLVDDEQMLERIFGECDNLIATHCEVEDIIQQNLKQAKERWGDEVPFTAHPEIRSVEACYKSAEQAVALARKAGARLHILHLTTEEEIPLFEAGPAGDKLITTEVCPHFLYFSKDDYEEMEGLIKCNPAIKEAWHGQALLQALKDGRIDLVSSDHAPHLLHEKEQPYLSCPSGIPLVQHTLQALLEYVAEGELTIEQVVEKMCHNPALAYGIKDRGFVREGCAADLVLVDLKQPDEVTRENIYYKCGWSPFLGRTFSSSILRTWVNGHLAFENGHFWETDCGERLEFQR